MRVRQADPDDAPHLAALHQRIFNSSVWQAPFWRDTGLDPNGLVGVAEDDTSQIGGLYAARVIQDEAELLTIGVLPDHRREGIGCLLLADLLARLRARSARQVFLEVETDNAAAVALYRAAGFVQVGERQNYYGRERHAVVMRMNLAPAPIEAPSA